MTSPAWINTDSWDWIEAFQWPLFAMTNRYVWPTRVQTLLIVVAAVVVTVEYVAWVLFVLMHPRPTTAAPAPVAAAAELEEVAA